MGTSKPYGGPGNKPPLLPPWALGGDSPAPPPIPPDNDPVPTPPPLPPPQPINPPPPVLPPLPTPPIIPGAWGQARRAMGNFARGGGRRELQNAARKYVQAKGGAARATRLATNGRAVTGSLGGFLSDVARRGVNEALRTLGLANIIGRPIEDVLTAIANALAPDGATLEEVAAREATTDTLVTIFTQQGVDEAGLERLTALDAEGIREAIKLSVAGYIYHRWLQELGQKIEEHTQSISEALRRERDIKVYVTEAVRLDLQGKDPLEIRWDGPEGQNIIERIYNEAYNL